MDSGVASLARRVAGHLSVPVAAVVLAVLTVTPRRGPVIAPDEMGYLAGARALAGAGNPLDMAGLPLYPIGWPALAAVPTRLFADDPAATYTATVVLQIVLLAATALLAMHVARSALDVDAGVAGLAAAIAVTTPSAIVTTRFVWSETFVTCWVTATAALLTVLYRAAFEVESPRRRDVVIAASAGAAVGWMPFAHGRLLPGAVGVGVLTVVILVVRGRRAPLVSFATSAIAVAVAGSVLTSFVRSEVWDDQATSNVEAARRGISSPADVWQTVQLIGGHAWTFLIGSFGLGAVAVWVALASWRRGPADERRSFGRRLVATPQRCLALACLIVLAATLSVSAAFFSGSVFQTGTNRQDHFLYGRYLAVFQPLAITVGLAAMVQAAQRGALRRVVTLGAVAVAAVLVGYGFVRTTGNDELTLADPFNPFTALNLARFGAQIGRATLETVIALGLVVGALAVVSRFVVGRWTRRWTAVALAAGTLPLIASNLVRWHDAAEATDGVDYRDAIAVAEYLDGNDVEFVRFDRSIWLGDRLAIQYWMPHLAAERVSLPTEIACDGATAVVTHPTTTAAPELVAGRLAVVRCDDAAGSVLVDPADAP